MPDLRPAPQHVNAYTLQDRVLWIRAANFAPRQAEAQQIDNIAQELPQLQNVRASRIGLPSGNHLMLPMKLWRKHLHGNNEALQPDMPLSEEIRVDAAVRQAVLAALPQ